MLAPPPETSGVPRILGTLPCGDAVRVLRPPGWGIHLLAFWVADVRPAQGSEPVGRRGAPVSWETKGQTGPGSNLNPRAALEGPQPRAWAILSLLTHLVLPPYGPGAWHPSRNDSDPKALLRGRVGGGMCQPAAGISALHSHSPPIMGCGESAQCPPPPGGQVDPCCRQGKH